MIRIIRSEYDYNLALDAYEELAAREPAVGSRDADTLELLGILIQDYEETQFALAAPSPLEAIRFRMEQQGLSARELIPFIGSRSKVSEVLSGKRRLTLPMIRALHAGLGIPLSSLIASSEDDTDEIDWSKFPGREMIRRGWIDIAHQTSTVHQNFEQAVRDFFRPIGSPQKILAFWKRTTTVRSAKQMDRYAVAAWAARVVNVGSRLQAPHYDKTSLSFEFLRELARVSADDCGPVAAKAILHQVGILLITEPHLPRTSVDGAALLLPSGNPVVALTLRHDRIDNFWFCLMHELVHVWKHIHSSTEVDFFDDLDADPGDSPEEIEADAIAAEVLIPEAEWSASPASKVRAIPAALQLANRLHIHPAIVAGRMRHQYKDFRVLSSLVGQGEVRKLFPEFSNETSNDKD